MEKIKPTIIQYAILYKATLEPMMAMHQDDEENPIVADTIANVVGIAAERSDLGVDDFLVDLLAPDSEYIVVRQEIETIALSPEEQDLLNRADE